MKNEFNEEFFYKLTKAEAQLFLDNFLTEAKRGFEQLIPEIEQAKLDYHFDINNIEPLCRHYADKAKTIKRKPDLSLPEFIRESSSYKKNLFDFEDDTYIIILRLSFFIGESFIKSYPVLHWGIGDKEFSDANKPVVKGFKAGQELPVFDVTKHSLRGLIRGEEFTLVTAWKNDI